MVTVTNFEHTVEHYPTNISYLVDSVTYANCITQSRMRTHTHTHAQTHTHTLSSAVQGIKRSTSLYNVLSARLTRRFLVCRPNDHNELKISTRLSLVSEHSNSFTTVEAESLYYSMTCDGYKD